MKYRIMYGEPGKGFVDGINNLIDEGWRPLGGVAVCPTPGLFPNIFQVMILDEPEEEE